MNYPWEPEWYREAVRAEIGRFATVVRDADPAAAVPTCPSWTLVDLIRHTGTIHRWAAAMVRDRAQRRYGREELDLQLPEDPQDYPDWLASGADLLAEALRATDPDAPMWAWGADKRARFWSRRMLHETTVHRADAELALGREPLISSELAVDGVDEFLVNLPHAAYFAPNVAKLRGDGEVLRYHATDGLARWRISLGEERFTWNRDEPDAPSTDGDLADVTVRASVADLYLLVWGRRGYQDAGRYEVSGDTAVLTSWVENSAI